MFMELWRRKWIFLSIVELVLIKESLLFNSILGGSFILLLLLDSYLD